MRSLYNPYYNFVNKTNKPTDVQLAELQKHKRVTSSQPEAIAQSIGSINVTKYYLP